MSGALVPPRHRNAEQKSEINGRAGDQPFGTNEETSTGFGGALRLGVGVRAGPGMVHVEAELDFVPIDHLITGDDNTHSILLTVGYSLFL